MADTALPGVADEQLVGEVSRVVFTNAASGFGVVEIAVAGEDDPAEDPPRAAGPLAGLVEGQPVRLVGSWHTHPRHGPTFDALYYELASPERAEALAAFLASSHFQGVGRAIAERLVDTFGLGLPDVLAEDPSALTRVRGVSSELAHRIGTAWGEAGALAALVGRLGACGVGVAVAQAAHRRFGDRAGAVLDEDPYRLLDVPGARWTHAEALARASGLAPDDERRLAAAAAAGHGLVRRRGGHVAVPAGAVVDEAARLLSAERDLAGRALDLAADHGRLEAEEDADLVVGGPRWYTPADRAAETTLARDIARLAGARSRVAAAVGEDVAGDPELTGEQATAVREALRRPVTVLTGGPGTGKTRTVVEVVAACEAADLRVACAAPTGRAAKRVEELTGRPAATVHRLLDAQPRSGGGFVFGYGARRRLPHDLVIVDEWSMADLHLAAALAAAIDEGAHLLLVGDAHQLPSVGPGAVLRDLLAAAGPDGLVGATRLTRVHRQAAESRIVTLAHEIDSGEVAPLAGRDGDVFAVSERGPAVPARVSAIVAERAPAFFDCRPSDVQVLAPMYRGHAGVDELNRALKEALNPAAGRPAVSGLHEGDRVVQTRNDAELGVANGDVGEVAATDRAAQSLEVVFPHGSVTYEGDRAADLRPAWCLTVHKAQGGEWPVVVLVCDPGHRVMHTRELVYTAVTRAQRGLLLVGDPRVLASAARRTGGGAQERATLLAERLRAAARAEAG